MPRLSRMLSTALCVACALLLAGCGFHLRRSAALPTVMQQQVYLHVNGGGDFARSLAAALRASKVDVLDDAAPGVATLDIPSAGYFSRMLTSGAVQRVGEYVVGMKVSFTLKDANGNTVVPTQTVSLSHDFAVDSTQLTAITSETEAIQTVLVREMTDAVMRRLEAQAQIEMTATPAASGTVVAPAAASSAG
ncbi:MAG TPA: LPS assembly lipoprotein LptE [Rhodanobacteraceae bacterium]